MKKEIGLFFICLILFSCTTSKQIISDEKNCKAVIVPSEDLISSYKSFISSCNFNIKQFADFDKIKNGILLYKWQEGTGSSTFLIINFEKEFSAFSKGEKFNREVYFSQKEKSSLKYIFQSLQKESYYQSCVSAHGHSSIYVLVIRRNDENIVQYYSPFTSPYGVNILNDNIKSIQKIFEIIDYK